MPTASASGGSLLSRNKRIRARPVTVMASTERMTVLPRSILAGPRTGLIEGEDWEKNKATGTSMYKKENATAAMQITKAISHMRIETKGGFTESSLLFQPL